MSLFQHVEILMVIKTIILLFIHFLKWKNQRIFKKEKAYSYKVIA